MLFSLVDLSWEDLVSREMDAFIWLSSWGPDIFPSHFPLYWLLSTSVPINSTVRKIECVFAACRWMRNLDKIRGIHMFSHCIMTIDVSSLSSSVK